MIALDSNSQSAVILVGGNSSRMKTNKALLHFNGKPMLEIIIDKLRPHFKEIMISSNNPERYCQFGLPIFKDHYAGRGPLAGIHACLKEVSSNAAFFVACDMPFVSPRLAKELLRRLNDGYQVAVPRKEKYLQPLHAAYSKDCLPAIEETLQSDRSKITSFYDSVKVNYYDLQDNPEFNWNTIFFNINTPEEFKLAQEKRLLG